jgi:hypothetical protein
MCICATWVDTISCHEIVWLGFDKLNPRISTSSIQGVGRDRAQKRACGGAKPTHPIYLSTPTPAKAALLRALRLAFLL